MQVRCPVTIQWPRPDFGYSGTGFHHLPVDQAVERAQAQVPVEAVKLETFEFMTQEPNGFATLEDAADAVAAYNPHRPRPKDVRGLAKNLRQGPDGRWRWHWDPRFLQGKQTHRVTGPERQNFLDDAARRLSVPTLLVRGKQSDVLSEDGASLARIYNRVTFEPVPKESEHELALYWEVFFPYGP